MKTTEGTKTYRMRNTQIFLTEEDGLPLEDNELLGVVSLYLVDKLDNVAVTVLAEVLGAQVRQPILGLDVRGADLAVLHQLLHENVPQRDVLCAKTVGAVADDIQRRRVIGLQRHAGKALVGAQHQLHVGAEHHLLQCPTSSASIVDCAVSPCSPIVKLIGALACITMHDDVDLPLSGSLPQLVSEKAASLRPPCL